MVDRRAFGTLPGGASVDRITLRGGGLELEVLTYGGIIASLRAPGARGEAANIVLGYDRLEPYLDSSPYFGALIGRYANRIAEARFSIDGRIFRVTPNEPPNHLHGGARGFDKHLWEAEPSGPSAIVLRRRSPDGEEGYPGTLDVQVRYALSEHAELIVDYDAVTDAPTHVNLTQHSYFNLRGDGTVLEHCVTINADTYLSVDDQLIPSGEFAPVANTRFDFLESAAIGARLDGGYDHNYVLNRTHGGLSFAARVWEPVSGRTLEITTTEPGLQFYSGHVVGYRGFCLEPQHFPDSPNRPDFPSTLLRPGEHYCSSTRYTFGSRP